MFFYNFWEFWSSQCFLCLKHFYRLWKNSKGLHPWLGINETAVGSILRRMVGTRLAEGGSAGYPLHRWQGIVPQWLVCSTHQHQDRSHRTHSEEAAAGYSLWGISGVKSWLCCLLAVWLYSSYLPTLILKGPKVFYPFEPLGPAWLWGSGLLVAAPYLLKYGQLIWLKVGHFWALSSLWLAGC